MKHIQILINALCQIAQNKVKGSGDGQKYYQNKLANIQELARKALRENKPK